MRQEAVSLLRCPICRGAFSLQGSSLVCGGRHCYDVARQGDVNLVPGRRETFYTKELFVSRAAAFEAGVYAPVVEAIGEAVRRYAPGDAPVMADAGCGEGYYTRSVCAGEPFVRIGFDLCKDAVRLAAKSDKGSTYFVGDLANIPLADHSVDVLLDVFTPANYAEFARVLRPGGVLVKLSPREGYLRQLREAAKDHLRHAQYEGGRVEEYARQRMTVLEERAISYTLPVGQELVRHLARMTPMLAGVPVEALDLSGVTEITIDETMVVGRFE
ncbi:MAG: methyltransferase domain-containing protein [Clostridia bacterium]|nr:methyltransferase domain-containing protein [Clostridia bacterium]